MTTPHARSHKAKKGLAHVENTTDATRGEPLAIRAKTRKAELEEALALLAPDGPRKRADLEMALAEVNQWLAGDVKHLAHVTGEEINRWLEATKHLAETAPKAKRPRG